MLVVKPSADIKIMQMDNNKESTPLFAAASSPNLQDAPEMEPVKPSETLSEYDNVTELENKKNVE